MSDLVVDFEQMDPEELIKNFTPDERELFDEMKELVHDTNSTVVFRYWELGRRFSNARECSERDRTKYGSRLVQRFSRALGWETPKNVYDMMRVAEVWPNRDDFKAMTTRSNGTFVLSFKHYVHLALVSDEKIRAKLLEQTLRNKWSESHLRSEMSKAGLVGVQSNNPTGRPPKLPSSVSSCLTHITQTSTTFRRLITDSWLCDEFNLTNELEAMPPDKVTPELSSSLNAVESTLQQMLQAGASMLDSIREAKEITARRLRDPGTVIEHKPAAKAIDEGLGKSIAQLNKENLAARKTAAKKSAKKAAPAKKKKSKKR